MTPSDLGNGYWYATDVWAFGMSIGIPGAANLRKDELPVGRDINFVADYLEANKGASRAEAIAAWTELKQLDVPKDYASWVKARTAQ